MNDSALLLRPMVEDDIDMLHGWLCRSHVAQWWSGGVSPSRPCTREKYGPRVLVANRVTPYIAVLDGRAVGYAQSYVALGSGDGWWSTETDPGVRGIDQFLAEPQSLGQGLGTSLVAALVDLLFRDPQVTRIQTDPDPTNLRAIRCYQKAGFRTVGEIVTPDGPALYMLRERAQ